MFRKYTVPVHSVPGRTRVKKNVNGARNVDYEVGRKYNREKKYNVPVRKTIGLLDDGDETRTYPNDNYFTFFSPLDSGYVYEDEHSSCLKAGAFIIIKEALETFEMDRWLRGQFGEDHSGLSEEPHLPLDFGVLHGSGEKGELAECSFSHQVACEERVHPSGRRKISHQPCHNRKAEGCASDLRHRRGGMKEKLGKEAETLWISSAANGK